MKLMRWNRCAVVAALVAAFGVSAPASGQTLVGDTVQYWTHAQFNGVPTLDSFAIVGTPNHEFSQEIIGVISTVNIEATSIRLDSLQWHYSPYFNTGFDPTYFEIRDLDFAGEPQRQIVGVNVSFSSLIGVHEDTPNFWPAFSANNVTFTGDSVRLSYGGYQFPAGSYVDIQLITAVPAPASVAAGLMMVAGVGLRRRR
jgi:hypothetical protein